MPIQPASSGRSNAGEKLSGKPAVEATPLISRAPSGVAGPGADRIELSEASRELAGARSGSEIPAGEIAADRLRAIATRIASGHYDRPDVRDAVLDRLLVSR